MPDLRMSSVRWPSIAASLALALGLLGLTATEARAFGPVIECPPELVSFATLHTLRDAGGPLADRFPQAGMNERGLACIGSASVSFLAFRADPEGLGGTVPALVEPAWLGHLQPRYHLAAADAVDQDGRQLGPFMPVAVPPDQDAAFRALTDRWVVVSGHFDAPAAASCHVVDGDDIDGLVEVCRARFVVSGISEASDPCPGAPVEWADLARVPEHLRAACLAGETLMFRTRIYEPANVWAVILPDVVTLVLLPPNPGDEVGGADWLVAFIPRDVAEAVPAVLRWPGGDDPRPPPLARIVAHIGHRDAATCRADPGAVIVGDDGRQYRWSDGDARALCQNTLVIDEIAAPERSPTPSSPDAPPTDDRVPIGLLAIAAAGLALAVGLGYTFRRRRGR